MAGTTPVLPVGGSGNYRAPRAVAAETSTQASKRPLERLIAVSKAIGHEGDDDDDDDDIPIDLPRRKRSRHNPVHLSSAPSVSVPPERESKKLLQDPQSSTTPTPSSSRRPPNGPPQPSQRETHRKLKVAEAWREVESLRTMVEEERTHHREGMLKVRQDMLLDVFKEQEKSNRLKVELDRSQRHCEKLTEHYDARLAVLSRDKDIAEGKYRTALAEADVLQLDLARSGEEVHFLEGDIAELRRIENDEAAKRRDNARGLPPPYGNLDDEEYLPPHSHTKDCGSLKVSALKMGIRTRFERDSVAAQARVAVLRESYADEEGIAGAELFCSLSKSLAECCYDLSRALEHASDFRATIYQKLTARPTTDRPKAARMLIQIGRVAFVAQRLVKLIIDLCWRMIGYHELKGTRISLAESDKAKAAVYHTQIDETALTAVRSAFRDAKPLLDLQQYSTQLTALRERFLRFQTRTTYKFFDKSLQWLDEQIEKGREVKANAPPPPPVQDFADNESVVSSDADCNCA